MRWSTTTSALNILSKKLRDSGDNYLDTRRMCGLPPRQRNRNRRQRTRAMRCDAMFAEYMVENDVTRRAQGIAKPPLTLITWPVTHDA